MNKLLLMVLIFTTTVFASAFKVDSVHSKISFKVKHLMITNVYGTFSKYDAIIDYDEKTKKFNTLSAKVDINSISTENAKRDKHLRSKDFFHVREYPLMSFQLLSLNEDEAIAELTIKGITQKVSFELENNGTIKDPRGNTRLGFSLEAKISRKSFNLSWNKVLEAGSVVVGDKIKIMVDIEAVKQK